MQHRANEEARRARDVRGELAATMRAWLAGELGRLQPAPSQPMDSVLGERVGLPHTGELLNKRSTGVTRFYGRTSEIRKQRWGAFVRRALDCRGVPVATLRRAFANVDRHQLGQMTNADLKLAGSVLEAQVTEDGFVELLTVVVDPVAVKKVLERTYTGMLCAFDGDEVASINLIDSPAGFLEKRSSVICKIYDGGRGLDDWKMAKQMSRENGLPRAVDHAALKRVRPVREAPLPLSAQSAFAEIERTEAVLKSGVCGDRMAATAQNVRARQQIGAEFIKAIRSNPANVLGGPRYQR